MWNIGVPYGSRTRVAAVKEKRPIVIQRNFPAWIALYRTLEDSRETLIGLLIDPRFLLQNTFTKSSCNTPIAAFASPET
jgi:hypothetical protein